MNTSRKPINQDYEENQSHIEHKKAAQNRQKQSRQKEVVDYGFEDEDEMKDYERFLK